VASHSLVGWTDCWSIAVCSELCRTTHPLGSSLYTCDASASQPALNAYAWAHQIHTGSGIWSTTLCMTRHLTTELRCVSNVGARSSETAFGSNHIAGRKAGQTCNYRRQIFPRRCCVVLELPPSALPRLCLSSVSWWKPTV
jgi:hypothetical protein